MIRKGRCCVYGKIGVFGKTGRARRLSRSRYSGGFGLLRGVAAGGDELLRRHARELLEDAVEVRQVAEARLGGGEEDVVRLDQKPLGVLDPALGEVLRDRLLLTAFELLRVAAVGHVGEV